MTDFPSYPEIANSVVRSGSFALGPDNSLWTYDPRSSIWRPDHNPPSLLDNLVNQTFGNAARIKHRNEVRPLVLNHLNLPVMGRQNARLVPFEDGVYDPFANRFMAHDPSNWTTAVIPHEYPDIETPEHPLFDAFLAEVFEGYEAQIPAIWQVIGYAMLPVNLLHKAVWFYGPTARNGKGTLLELIRRIVGSGNTSTVALREMSSNINRFKAADMHNRIVNIDFDASGAFISDTSAFLQVTAGEPTQVERKNGQPFLLNPPGLLLVASNTIPGVRDAGPGYFERWYPLYFPNSFAGREDRDLIEKLATEIPHIIQSALQSLVWVVGQGDFVQTRTSIAVRDVFAARSDNVRAWLDDRTIINDKATTGIMQLYRDYEAWARANNNGHKLERLSFKDRLEAINVLGLRRHTVNGYEGYTIDLREGEEAGPVIPALSGLRGVDVPPPFPSMAELHQLSKGVK